MKTFVTSWVLNGYIGTGKTTAIREIQRLLSPKIEVLIFEENVEEWKDYYGYNLLQKMYEANVGGKDKWIARFQRKAIDDIIYQDRKIERLYRNALCIQERDLESILKVFLPHNQNKFDEVDYFLNIDACKNGLEMSKGIKKSIFLDISKEEAYNRMMQRARTEESSLNFESFRDMCAEMDVLKRTSDHIVNVSGLNQTETARRILQCMGINLVSNALSRS